jgi:hypothetical protein
MRKHRSYPVEFKRQVAQEYGRREDPAPILKPVDARGGSAILT